MLVLLSCHFVSAVSACAEHEARLQAAAGAGGRTAQVSRQLLYCCYIGVGFWWQQCDHVSSRKPGYRLLLEQLLAQEDALHK
jgi:hypothetical protein